MNIATILNFVTLFFAGILAGIEIVIHYGLRSAQRGSGRTVAAPASSSTGNEATLAGARLLYTGGAVRDCRHDSRWWYARLLVPVRGSARPASLDLDQDHRHRPYQQCYAHLAA